MCDMRAQEDGSSCCNNLFKKGGEDGSSCYLPKGGEDGSLGYGRFW